VATGVVFPGVERLGVKLLTCAHLLPKLRSRVVALFALMLSWRGVIFVYRFQSPPKVAP